MVTCTQGKRSASLWALAITARAGDSSADFAKLKAEYNAASDKFREEWKAKGAKATLRIEDLPGPAFAPRFLQFAKDHPGTPEALHSLNTALQAGFDRLVLVIRQDIEADFRASIGKRLESRMEVSYVFQESGANRANVYDRLFRD